MFGGIPGHSPYESISTPEEKPKDTTKVIPPLKGCFVIIDGSKFYSSSAYVPPKSKTTVEPAPSPSTL